MRFDDNRNLSCLVCFLFLIFMFNAMSNITSFLIIVLFCAVIWYLAQSKIVVGFLGNMVHYLGDAVHGAANTIDHVTDEDY